MGGGRPGISEARRVRFLSLRLLMLDSTRPGICHPSRFTAVLFFACSYESCIIIIIIIIVTSMSYRAPVVTRDKGTASGAVRVSDYVLALQAVVLVTARC